MSRFLFAVWLMLTALLQASFFPATGLLGIVPDFVLMFLLVWAATHGVYEGMFWAFGIGLWIDLLTMERLGIHAIAFLAVAAIGGAIRGRMFRSGAILPVVAVLVATLASNLIVLLLTAGGGGDLFGALRLIVMTALLNALLVPIAYAGLFVFDHWIPHRV